MDSYQEMPSVMFTGQVASYITTRNSALKLATVSENVSGNVQEMLTQGMSTFPEHFLKQ